MDTTYRNPYIGHPSQLLRINDYVMVSGFAHGIRATDIHNGPLSLTVCADKGMDFPYLSYKGMNIGYISPSGLVGSTYYDGEGKGFLQGFLQDSSLPAVWLTPVWPMTRMAGTMACTVGSITSLPKNMPRR